MNSSAPENKQRKVLGRGLSALLPQRTPPASAESASTSAVPEPFTHGSTLPISQIDPNPLQPRSIFDPHKIQDLARSIEANGLIQPLIVRRKGERYELIAGERRLRAAQLAGLDAVPALIQDYADDRLLEIALVENIQREDLNPIETAQALDRLAREMNLSHEEIARRTGKDRTTITNLLRLLRLPSEIQLLLAERRLSMGHARAILGLASPEQQLEMANKASAQGYSVRQVERLVQKATETRDSAGAEPDKKQDPNLKAAIAQLETVLGTRVRIQEKNDERGRIEIEYYSQDELNRLYELIVAGAHKT
jgi:ParB family chromosome partitioning protein